MSRRRTDTSNTARDTIHPSKHGNSKHKPAAQTANTTSSTTASKGELIITHQPKVIITTP